MFSVTFTFEMNCTAETLFAYLTEQQKLTQWFAPQVIAVPVEGTVAAFAFEYQLDFKMEITKLVPGELVAWECIDGYNEWVGSKVTFEIIKKEGKVMLKFNHSGLAHDDKKEKTTHSWEEYLKKLKKICETQ